MKMVFKICFILLCIRLYADVISIDKLGHFSYTQNIQIVTQSIIADGQCLYVLTISSLQIFQANSQGDLELLSVLPIDSPSSFVKKDNYIYLATHSLVWTWWFEYVEPPKLLKIDVSDPYVPEIMETIYFTHEDMNHRVKIIGEYLELGNPFGGSKIYSIPELDYITTLPQDNLSNYYLKLHEIQENHSIHQTDNHLFEIYDHSDITNVLYLATSDVSYIHTSNTPINQFETYQDSILIISDQHTISFWDISNPDEWQNISHYDTEGMLSWMGLNFTVFNDQYLLLTRWDGFEVVCIEDVTNPQLVNFNNLTGFYPNQMQYNNGYFYGGTSKLPYFSFDHGTYEIEFVDHISEFPLNNHNLTSFIHNDFLIINTTQYLIPPERNSGLYLYDLTDPTNPQILFNDLYEVFAKQAFHINDILIINVLSSGLGYGNPEIRLYDISDPSQPILLSAIYDAFSNDILVIDENDSSSIYVFKKSSNIELRKYDISDPTAPSLIFEGFTVPGRHMTIHNGYGYVTEPSSNDMFNLHILSGLDENTPQLVQSYHNYFYDPSSIPIILDNYLFFRSRHLGTHHFYSIDDPIAPEIIFSLENLTTDLAPLTIYKDLLFCSPDNGIQAVYSLDNEPGCILDPIAVFQFPHSSSKLHIVETEEEAYILDVCSDNLTVYESDIQTSADDPTILPPEVTFANFPNPFNTETTFAINLPEINEDAVIELYNIKGQLLRKLEVPPSEEAMTHITWDGRDSRGRVAASGIYLAKLRNGSDTYTHRVVLLK